MSSRAFNPTAATSNIAATTTSSAATSLTTPPTWGGSGQIRVYNSGSVPVFLAFGGSGVGAATAAAGMPVPAGGVEVLSLAADQNYVRAITASGTATIYFTPGEGV